MAVGARFGRSSALTSHCGARSMTTTQPRRRFDCRTELSRTGRIHRREGAGGALRRRGVGRFLRWVRRSDEPAGHGHSRCLPEASPIRRMCKPVIQNGFSDHFPDHHDGHRGRLGRQPEQFWRDLWRWPVTSAAVWDAVVRRGWIFVSTLAIGSRCPGGRQGTRITERGPL
jgi:hypothetical protein